MAPLSYCDLTTLDETIQLQYFQLSRSSRDEPRTCSSDDTNCSEKPSWVYWDWPSVNTEVQQDSTVYLFSVSHMERNLKATAAKFNEPVEKDEECNAETSSTEQPIKGPFEPCYWDWPADKVLKQTSNRILEIHPCRKLLSISSQDDPTSFDYYYWPTVKAEDGELDISEVGRATAPGQSVLREPRLTSPVQETDSALYWAWSHTPSVY